MVDLDEAIVGRYEIKGEVFEILIDPRIVKYLKEGKEVDVANHMAVEEIFKDAKKGTKQSPEKLKEFFDTDDIGQVARTILQKGQGRYRTGGPYHTPEGAGPADNRAAPHHGGDKTEAGGHHHSKKRNKSADQGASSAGQD